MAGAATATEEAPAARSRQDGEPVRASALISDREREATCQKPDCGDEFVYVEIFEGMSPPDVCRSCRKEADREAFLRERDRRPANSEPEILDQLQRCGVNVDAYAEATLESFIDDADPAAGELADAYLEAVTSRRRGRPWAYFHGPTGNGKTFLAVALIRELLERGALRPADVHFVNAEVLLLRIQETYDKGDGDSAYQLMKRYAEYKLLVVDDLGVRGFGRDHPRRIFYLLAERRAGRPTIWTSNLTPEDLEAESPEMDRIVSRILGECGYQARFIHAFKGPDRRAMRSAGQA